MPIAGLSDIRRMPRIGKIRLGVKDISPKSGKEYPKAVDFFVVDAEDEITSPAAAAAFTQVYGPQPRELDVMFPVNDPDLFFPQYLKRYGKGSGLLCKGDGAKATAINKDTGEFFEIECNPEECLAYRADPPQCRRVGTLQFLLPKVPGLGIWQIDTTSFHSIVNLNSSIHFILDMSKVATGDPLGRIALLPLKLRLVPKEVAPDGKKKIVWVLELVMEQFKFEDFLAAMGKPAAAVLMPPLDESRPPRDLYARSVVGEAETPTAAAATGPAQNDDSPDDGPVPDDPEVAIPADHPGQAGFDIEAKIAEGFTILGLNKAQQVYWKHQHPDPEDLLNAIHAAVEQRDNPPAPPNPPAETAGRPKAQGRTTRSKPPAPSAPAPTPAMAPFAPAAAGGNGHRQQSSLPKMF